MSASRPPLSGLTLSMAVALSLVSALICPDNAHAHGSGHATRYVATDGQDRGDCAKPSTPCKSLGYALAKSGKGDTIHVAAGSYAISGAERVNLLAGVVPIAGGYSRADGFAKADPVRQITELVGVPFEFREQLEARGFKVMQDSKGNDIRLTQAEQKLLGSWQKISGQIEGPANCAGGKAGEYDCNKVDLLSHIPLNEFSTDPDSANDIWGFMDRNDGREYALIGLSNGTAIVDISTPATPREVGTVRGPNSLWRDVHVYQYFDNSANRYKAYAYVTTEAGGGGVQVIDLSNLPDTVSLAHTIRDVETSHTLYGNFDYADGTPVTGLTPTLYIAGSNVVVTSKDKQQMSRGSWRAYELSNPAQPRFVHQPVSTNSYMHDGTGFILTDERTAQCAEGHNPCEILFDFNEDTLDIWDVTDKTNPFRLAKAPYGGAGYSHSGWFTSDKRYLILNDELDEQSSGNNTRFRTFDLSNLRNPVVVANYYGPTRDIDHNTYIRGSRGYVAHYRRGMVVLDVSNPLSLSEAGFFDSALLFGPASQFNGAWGTYPYFPSGSIVISDIENGLYVVRDNTVAGGKGRLGFGVSHYRVDEEAGTLTIPVWRSGGASGAVSARITSSDGTATAGADYSAVDVTLNWADGERGQKLLTLPLTDDGEIEVIESLQLTMEITGGADLDGDSALRIDLSSAENAGQVEFASTSSSASESAGSVTLTVQRVGGSGGSASLQYQTQDASAAAGSDYTASSGTLTWADGDNASKTVVIAITNDSSSENTESFDVVLSNASGATLGSRTQVTVTVQDDDGNNDNGDGGGSSGGGSAGWLLTAVLAALGGHRLRRRQ